MTYVCQFDWISLPFARGWKNNSSKSSSTGQYDWPMVIETPRRYLGFLMGFKCEFCVDSMDYYSRRGASGAVQSTHSRLQWLTMRLVGGSAGRAATERIVRPMWSATQTLSELQVTRPVRLATKSSSTGQWLSRPPGYRTSLTTV
jgi:hypothetical protein